MALTTNVTRGGLIAAGLATGGVALAWVVWGGAMFSPGGLSTKADPTEVLGGVATHAALSRNCAACHASLTGGQPMSIQCLACHTDTQSDLRDSTSLHGGLDNARECLACHTEHGGPTASLVKSGTNAGNHDRFGFALAAHRRTDGGRPFRCADCHSAGTFKFDSTRCENCHRDYQPRFVAAHAEAWGSDCRSCHDGTDRFSRGRFSHDSTRFQLAGAHRPVECTACHVDVRTLAGFGRASTDCVGCHRKDDKHKGRFGTSCGSCHAVKAWTPATFDHKASTDCVSCHQKDDKHKGRFGTSCGSCHTVKAWTPATFDHKASTDCVSCHQKDDEHRGQFGTDCGACHTVNAWKPATFDHTFPLDHGEGGRVACKVCHEPGRPYKEYTCYGCHEHSPQRILRKHQEEGISGNRLSDCVRCHRTGREHEGGGRDDRGHDDGGRDD